ncbi:uncharacterized protein LOC133822531 [Humulus lupulus]|uniref:uncharacterized protein LOC133822531 n=1 Tax=Humulus lupulus TaxID=3486 RepID=UPI002B40CA99|nr:uncharacterized protein LOC133822531 [Humulus lupulus]
MFLPIHFWQVDGMNDSWQFLLPNSVASFLWEDLGRRRLLELLIDGDDQSKSQKFDIDEISANQPMHVTSGTSRALSITIIKEEKVNVVKISDWLPESEPIGILSKIGTSPLSQLSLKNPPQQQSPSTSDSEFHVIVELVELGVSIIDHTPEEILYLSVQTFIFSYSTGLGSGISRPQKVGDETDYILKFSVTMQSNGSLDLCVYPYIGFYGPENAAFLINIHEPIIWRLHEMIQQVNFNRLYDNQTSAVAVDPVI